MVISLMGTELHLAQNNNQYNSIQLHLAANNIQFVANITCKAVAVSNATAGLTALLLFTNSKKRS